MDQAQDVHVSLADLIDQPVATDDQLSHRGLIELGHGAPTPGHHGRPLFFLDPRALLGALTEIEQEPKPGDPVHSH